MDAQSRSAIAILVVSSILMATHAESHPCVNNAPDGGYHDVGDWAQTPRPLAGLGGIFVDSKDNVWLFDRCGNKGCANSNEAPIFEISPEGKVLKNIGAGLFVF